MKCDLWNAKNAKNALQEEWIRIEICPKISWTMEIILITNSWAAAARPERARAIACWAQTMPSRYVQYVYFKCGSCAKYALINETSRNERASERDGSADLWPKLSRSEREAELNEKNYEGETNANMKMVMLARR